MQPFVPNSYDSSPDHSYWSAKRVIAGVDEAGRGALAGPVVAAAVVLDPRVLPTGITDSKKLTKAVRETVAKSITQHAVAVGVGIVDNETIDEINILQATFLAMHAALDAACNQNQSPLQLDHILVDGNRFTPWKVPHSCIVDGDALSLSIGAASIIAKTERDRLMQGTVHAAYPQYGFIRHVGYATTEHRQAILQYGPCEHHRHTFLRKLLG